MPLVSITRFRLRSALFLPAFAWQARQTIKQLEHAPGFLGGKLLNDRRLALWTMTSWTDEGAMKAYMTSGAHLRAMPLLLKWGDEASVVRWEQDAAVLPDWRDADLRMRAEGRTSKVRNPVPGHADLTYAEPRTTRGVAITPKGPQ